MAAKKKKSARSEFVDDEGQTVEIGDTVCYALSWGRSGCRIGKGEVLRLTPQKVVIGKLVTRNGEDYMSEAMVQDSKCIKVNERKSLWDST